MIPIAFPNKRTFDTTGIKILAADVGGTKANLALFNAKGDTLSLVKSKIFPSKGFNSFTEVVQAFHADLGERDCVCIGIAGPVIKGKAKATNLDWVIEAPVLRQELNITAIHLLNDLEANAYGLAALQAQDFISLNAGNPEIKGNAAMISPGTGLGEAGLFWNGTHFFPFATEGGHADFSPRADIDIELLKYLKQTFKSHVSCERVVSGQGIQNIFNFLKDVKGWHVPDWLEEKFLHEDPPKAIGEGAKDDCPICVETIRLFIRYLAIEAANLALKVKATGGIFIGGGIVPKFIDELISSDFSSHFTGAGRLKPLLEGISVKVILNPNTALLGAAYYGAYGPQS